MITIENKLLKAGFNEKGAETASLIDKSLNTQLIWQSEERSWKGQAYNLFPVIGRLNNGKYIAEGKEYESAVHGFARNSEFKVVKKTKTMVMFLLSHSEETLKVYPYKFNLFIKYTLLGSRLVTKYIVENTDDKTIYFGIGGHPGFTVPAKETGSETDISGNKLIFEKKETPVRFIFDQSKILIIGEKPYGEVKEIKLSKALFSEDAILLKGLKSKYVILARADGVKIKFRFRKSNALAFWTKLPYGAFLCIEPWCGVPDRLNKTTDIKHKEGYKKLLAGKKFECGYTIEIM